MEDTVDSNGTVLDDGDSVSLIRDLKIKGMSKTLKRGTAVKSIRLTGNPEQVECRLGKSTVVLRTEFLKKA
jgi:protein PhnA